MTSIFILALFSFVQKNVYTWQFATATGQKSQIIKASVPNHSTDDHILRIQIGHVTENHGFAKVTCLSTERTKTVYNRYRTRNYRRKLSFCEDTEASKKETRADTRRLVIIKYKNTLIYVRQGDRFFFLLLLLFFRLTYLSLLEEERE